MKKTINTDNAPAAIGPYSQAVKVVCDTVVYCSGQIPLHPETGEIGILSDYDHDHDHEH